MGGGGGVDISRRKISVNGASDARPLTPCLKGRETAIVVRIRAEAEGVVIPVKAVPGASRDRYAGEWDGRAKIAVAAPPEGGKANRAICSLLARLLGVRRADVCVVRGETTPLKEVAVRGVTVEQVRAMLDGASS